MQQNLWQKFQHDPPYLPIKFAGESGAEENFVEKPSIKKRKKRNRKDNTLKIKN